MPFPVNPTQLATSFVAFDNTADGRVVVRRIERSYLIRWAWICALIALLPLVVPTLTREPSYFVNGTLIAAFIIAVVLFVGGMASAYLWSHSGARKDAYFGPVLSVGAADLTLHSQGTSLPEACVLWEQVVAVRTINRAKTRLAFTIEPLNARSKTPPADETTSTDETTLSVSEGAGSDTSVDDDYTPPPASVATTADFDSIEPMAAPEAPEMATDHSAKPVASEAGNWRRTMYGTPYVVSFKNCDKSAEDVLALIAQLRTA